MSWKKWGLAFALGSLWMTGQAQEAAWISDQIQTSVNASPDINGKFIGTISAGEPVTLLRFSDNGQYAQIKTDTIEGWVSARYIVHEPSKLSRFAAMVEQVSAVEQEAQLLRSDQSSSDDNLNQLQAALETAQGQLQQTRQELVTLQRASQNVITIDKHNRELENKIVQMEQENLSLRHANARLESADSRQEMIIGGGLVLAGFLLNAFFGLFLRRARHRSYDNL